MTSLTKLFAQLRIHPINSTNIFSIQPWRGITKFVDKPKPGEGIAYRRKVHFPSKYTVEPLNVTNLAGRDPVTGRVVAKGIGGGIKHKYHWIKWVRDGPSDPDHPQLEKVVDIIFDGCRTPKVAVVAVGDELKYIIATENMKAGDIIRTSRHIPRIPGIKFNIDIKINTNFYFSKFGRTKEMLTLWAHFL